MGWCPEVCTIFQLRSDQQQIEQNNHLLCLSYDTLVNTVPKGVWLPFSLLFIFFFPTRLSDCWLALGLWCTQSPGWFPAVLPGLVLPWGVGEQDSLGQESPSPSKMKGGWAARMPSHRPWGVKHCFSLSPFTMCLLKLLSLPISSHGADSSILLGGSSALALCSPTFAVLPLRKVVEERYMNFTTNRVFPCQVIFDPERDTQYLS